ncbi:MAG: PP2C family protein-serine/threonine phosphatase [Ignavibacteriales bacterium]|nr:PP2C family protein-serine/threonine phosphatase [Ignavibacteriales bacterium]
MEKLQKLFPFLLLLVLSSLVIVQFFPSVHTYGGLRLPLDAQAIELRSRELLVRVGINTEGLTPQAQLKYNQALFREVEERYGVEKANELMRSSIPVHHWDVTWRKASVLSIAMNQSEDPSKQGERMTELIRGNVFMRLGTDGRLMEFERKIPDSVVLPGVSQEEARKLARAFVEEYGAQAAMISDTAQPASQKRIELKKRTDHEFVWNTRSPVLDNPISVTVLVAGSHVVHFEVRVDVPEQYKKSEIESASQAIVPIVYFLVVLLMVIVAFRRFRSFEIGFRLGTFIGVVAALALGVEIYLTMQSDKGWEILIPLILGPLFYGGGLVIVWAVGESVTRETWKEKLISFDLLSKGYVIHSRVGKNVVRGIALGCAAFAFTLVLTFLAGKITHLWFNRIEDSAIESFGSFASWVYLLGIGLSANAYKLAIIILFTVTFLRRRISSAVLLIGLGALILALTSRGDLSPVWLGMLIQLLAGAVSVWAFYRYDALAAFLSLYTFSVLQGVGGLLVAGNPTYTQSGLFVIAVLVLLVVGGLASQLRKREITDFDDIMPAFAKHITERQRLQQELEIARSVQMSFLPKANPNMAELDIASRCDPALEVGGDYYDFIHLPERRLGVVVGDVSGKGTQAAFYMTLTKGFVHALAEVSNSPSVVLTQVNKLFYENVDRGVFISMVYGVFDIQRHVLTLARAGHNPVIMRKTLANDVQVVNPMGLALGLDPGATFAKSIQEVSIPFQSGDLFVFYTDGFPEAMNKTLEEFGEERLCRTVENYAHGSAAQIMDGVFADMRQFVGKAKQHDDMTIVVVKVV